MDLLEKPDKMDEEKVNADLGRLFWGKNGGKFSLRRLKLGFIKKRLRGKK
ncbi:hypothetical protein LCGC14_0796490 [marine sediment metagenome]|uniref:Uncharacterized protein n=1 Tax=marine sediment metagenome TaxID=412755 RepID=A0A0F9PQU8_9ZZZZ|nr:MAG: hypothetical protein Lokiarch_12380 [Candidatus Lokiarchaeum sp. GC14_75]